ncbi:CapA family protein [Paenibacillus caui]|uniref:CapA family protein n=1 Tax=Paenibacillus caui TaxID=2873927 RepID=UPI001CA952B9|nr:CapA family protein [Paenibacillus caui]
MYPPRSEKYKQERKKKQQRQSRIWMLVNLTLIVIVCLFGLYLYYYKSSSSGEPGNESPPVAMEESSPNSGNGSDSPSSSAEADFNGSAGPSSPDPADASASADPESSEEAEPSATGTAAAAGTASGGSSGKAGDSLLLHFGGDTLFTGKVADKLAKEGFDYPFQFVSGLFQEDDLTVLNLETPVTERGVGAENKQYVFKSSPRALDAMSRAGVDAVNLANNHTLDQGEEGLLDTMDHLKNAGIPYVGAGANADEAYAPCYVDRKGIKIALFGFSRVLPKADWNAGKNTPGVAGVYDPGRAYEAIGEAKKKADLVIVVAHWGKERVQQQDSKQTTLAHGFIDAGADLVIGGHPHVLQGLEQYKGKWIAYSTGNFIFTRSTNEKTWETAIFEARCSKEGSCSMKLIPYEAALGQPVPMDSVKGASLLKEIQDLSPGVTVDNEGNVLSR